MELDKLILNEELRKKFLDLKNQKPAYDIAFFLPQCLRSNYCEAEKNNGLIDCTSCYALREDGEKCIAGQVKDSLRDIFQYHLNKDIGIYIVNGGSIIPKILVDYGKPKIIVGIACPLEIDQAKQLLNYIGVESKSIPLIQDGCSETKIDMEKYALVINSLIK